MFSDLSNQAYRTHSGTVPLRTPGMECDAEVARLRAEFLDSRRHSVLGGTVAEQAIGTSPLTTGGRESYIMHCDNKAQVCSLPLVFVQK